MTSQREAIGGTSGEREVAAATATGLLRGVLCGLEVLTGDVVVLY